MQEFFSFGSWKLGHDKKPKIIIEINEPPNLEGSYCKSPQVARIIKNGTNTLKKLDVIKSFND